MTSQCALNHHLVWLTRNLEIWMVKKKQHSTSSQWIRKGENDGCSFPWRFGLAVSRVGQCQRWKVGLLMCFTRISARCQLTNLSTWSLHVVVKLSNWTFNIITTFHRSTQEYPYCFTALVCPSVLPLRSTASQVPHLSKAPSISDAAMGGRRAWVHRYRALPAKW